MNEAPRYQIMALDASVHDRANFDCGEAPLNRYLREQASQDIKRRIAGCWVLVSRDSPDHVLGFYTLSGVLRLHPGRRAEVGEKVVTVEDAFKDPKHPFRIAIVCAMWLTGFDVESLSTLYIDKPMKAHTLMQAIARANRRCEGKDFGLIVDYNGMLRSLREALAQYALGDDNTGDDATGRKTALPSKKHFRGWWTFLPDSTKRSGGPWKRG